MTPEQIKAERAKYGFDKPVSAPKLSTEDRLKKIDDIISQSQKKQSNTPTQTLAEKIKPAPSFVDKLVGGIKPFLSSAAKGGEIFGNAMGMGEFGQGIAGSIFQYTPAGKQSLQELSTGKISPAQHADVVSGINPTSKQVLGSAAQTAINIGTAGLPATNTAATATGRILTTAGVSGAVGSAYGAAEGFKKEGNWSETLKNVVSNSFKSGAVSAVAGGAIQAGVEALKGVPKLLSYTSATPEGALQRRFDVPNPSGDVNINPFKTTSKDLGSPIAQTYSTNKVDGVPSTLGKQPELKTPEQISGYAKTVVKDLRKQMSLEYGAAKETVINNYQDVAFGLNTSELKTYNKVVDDFGIDGVENIKDMTPKEGLELLAQVNELYNKKAVKESPLGIPVKKLHDMLRSKLVNATGGVGGETDTLLKNYASKMEVFNNINDVVGAWKTKPTSINTYQTRLMSIFNDNKPAYLDAVMDLEKLTGQNLQDAIARYQTRQFIPPLKGTFGFDEIFRLVLTPLTSPKIAGVVSQTAGKISQMSQSQFANYLRNIISGQTGKNIIK